MIDSLTKEKCQAGDVMGADWWPLPANQTAHEALRRDYLRYFAQQTTGGLVGAVLASAKVPQDGLFGPACYQHTDDLCLRGGSKVRKVRYVDSLYDWVLRRGLVPHRLVEAACPVLEPACNTHCGC